MCQIQCSWDASQKFSLDWMIELFRSRGQIFEVKKVDKTWGDFDILIAKYIEAKQLFL